MKAALVIMAAGMAERYGGNKQLEGIGPGGELLMEYSVFGALRAGFTKVVFIIKPEMRDLIERLCGARIAKLKTAAGEAVEVCYACQDVSSVPSSYSIPVGRKKPLGTVHALLCAREWVSEPFAVINADDYYGAEAFCVMHEALSRLAPKGEGAMAAYRLGRTLSKHGGVSRGICGVKEGRLRKIAETHHLRLFPDGSICSAEGRIYAPQTPVSMNFWGFTPWIFERLEVYFAHFLRHLEAEDRARECVLSVFVGELLKRGEIEIRVLQSDARWFGMTYREDRAMVAEELKKLHDAGIYPPTLKR